MKILGIDDNADLLQLSEIALTSGGHEYTGVDRGEEGVGKYEMEIMIWFCWIYRCLNLVG